MGTVHFISGLPRSGSTLLSAIFRQNKRFHADISSPVPHLYLGLQGLMSGKHEQHPMISDIARTNVLRGVFNNYYQDISAEVILDTNRVWAGKVAGISYLFPTAKIICCVRNVSAIVNSIEIINDRNPLEPNRIFEFNPGTSLSGRVEALMGASGLIGAPLAHLRQAFFGPHTEKLILVRYEKLIEDPRRMMSRLYAFLGERPFEHDFKALSMSAPEFDRRLGAPGLHDVAGPVRQRAAKLIIPPDLVQRLDSNNFWLSGEANAQGVEMA
jgi:sulfotransferase